MSGEPYTPNPDPDSMLKVQHIQDWYFSYANAKGLHDLVDYKMMGDIKLIDARPEGRSVWAITIPRYLCNLNGALHGGGAAVLLDMCTMTALGPLAKHNFWVFLGGLTRSLSISYLHSCRENTPVIVDSVVVQAGQNMALIRGEIKSPDGKVVYAVVDHNKVNIGPPPGMMEYEPEPREQLEPNLRLGGNYKL